MELHTPEAQQWKEQIDNILNDAISSGQKIHMPWLVERLSYPNRKKLERDFRRYLDTTYCEYLNKLRLHIASRMLCHENVSVKAVALSSGYQNPATFCNAFKRVYGTGPSQYRTEMIEHFHEYGCPFANGVCKKKLN